MAEELIKARIVFDTGAVERAARGLGAGGARGGAAAGGGGFFAGAGAIAKNIAQIATGVAIGNKIADTFTNLMNKLVSSSPLLQNTVNIMRKSMEFMLRPIGDTIGKILKPVAIWWLKYALKWYKDIAPKMEGWFGKLIGNTEKEGMAPPLLAIETAAVTEAAGKVVEPPGVEQVREVGAQMAEVGKSSASFSEKLGKLIPLGLLETLKALGSVFMALWDALKGIFSFLWELLKPVIAVLGIALLGALKLLTFALLGVAAIIEFVALLFRLAALGIKAVWESIAIIAKRIWSDVKADFLDTVNKLKTFFTETIPAAWETLQTKIGEILTGIKDAVSGAVTWILGKLDALLHPFGGGKKEEKEEKGAGASIGGTAKAGTIPVLKDFMVRGNTVIPFSPADTIIGTKGGFPGGTTTNVTVNISALDASSIKADTLRLITDAIDRAQRRGIMSRTMQAAGS